MISSERCFEAVEGAATRIAEVGASHPHAETTRYPGHDVEALLRHVITIHEWVAETVSSLSQEPLPQNAPDASLSGDALLERFDAGWRGLLDTLRTADPTASVWTFGTDASVAFWIRRMAHETALHAWDADSATTPSPHPIPLDLAVTGLGEGLRIHVERPLRKREIGGAGETIGLACTDADADWTVTLREVGVTVEDGVGNPDARLAGTASDLWLAVTGRTTSNPVTRFGDESALATFESALGSIRAAM